MPRITADRARCLLGDAANNLSDTELKHVLLFTQQLAELVVDSYDAGLQVITEPTNPELEACISDRAHALIEAGFSTEAATKMAASHYAKTRGERQREPATGGHILPCLNEGAGPELQSGNAGK